MKCLLFVRSALCSALVALLGFGCASKQETLPPLRMARLASSPEEVQRALPGTWAIDVGASAEVLARAQFQPREVTVLRREAGAPPRRETTTVAERFDPEAYHEARNYWHNLLSKPDMQWQLTFNPDGTGEHWAIVQTGSEPQATPFQWRLDGWRLHLDYPADAKFRSFDVEMPSALELNYPMQPLGDHLVLRRVPR